MDRDSLASPDNPRLYSCSELQPPSPAPSDPKPWLTVRSRTLTGQHGDPVLTLVHDVLLQGLGVVGHGLVQVLQELAHAGHGDAEGLHEQQQLLGLQVLQG